MKALARGLVLPIPALTVLMIATDTLTLRICAFWLALISIAVLLLSFAEDK